MYKKFRYKTKLSVPNTSGRCSVLIRVSYGGSRVELYSGITLQPKQWSENRERVKQGCVVDGTEYNVLNDTLDEQEKFVRDYFNNSATRSLPVSLKDLKERFNHKFKKSEQEQSDEFFFMFDKFREETSELKGWQKDRKEMFERLENKVRDFKPDIKFSDLSIATMDAFKVYLSKSMFNNALIKHLTYFKQFITWCRKKGCQIHEEFFTYEPRLPKAKLAIRFLTLEELDTIFNLNLEGKEGLERVRDIFVFQCYTALRISDVLQLKHENISKDETGKYQIRVLTEKDDDIVNIPLAKRALFIYNKYKKYKYENNLVFPVISTQKYNEHLKELGKIADLQGEWIDYQYRLNEKVIEKHPKHELSSHTARRTFIVSAMNEKIPLDLIALLTSHSDVKAMKPYIKLNTRGTKSVIDAIDKATVKTEKEKKKKEEKEKLAK